MFCKCNTLLCSYSYNTAVVVTNIRLWARNHSRFSKSGKLFSQFIEVFLYVLQIFLKHLPFKDACVFLFFL